MSAAESTDIEYFYDDRIKNFEAERQKITNYISLIKPNQRELHILQWEGKQQSDNATSIHNELVEYNDDLRKVVKQTNEAKIELQNIALKHIANQSQIQRLGELSQPVQRDITYFFDDKYSLVAPIGSDGRRDSNLSLQKPKITKAGDVLGPGPSRTATPSMQKQPKTGEVLRLEARLRDETRRLTAKLEEFQLLILSIESGISTAKEEGDRTLDPSRKEAARMIAENNKYDHQCFLSVSELLKLRLRIMVAQREEMEELNRLNDEKKICIKNETKLRNQLVYDIKELSENLRIDKASREDDFAAQLNEVTEKCDVLKKKEKIALSKKNLKSTKIIEKLEVDVAYAQDRYERLKRRNVLEMEGYNNEASMLRLRLSHIEKVYSARQRQTVRKQLRGKDSSTSTSTSTRTGSGSGSGAGNEGMSIMSDSLGHSGISDKWT